MYRTLAPFRSSTSSNLIDERPSTIKMSRARQYVDLSERVFGALLRLYPRSFRARFGEEMLFFFRARRNEARHQLGVRGTLRLWRHLLIDIALSAPIERLRAPRHVEASGRCGAMSRWVADDPGADAIAVRAVSAAGAGLPGRRAPPRARASRAANARFRPAACR